MKNLVDIILKVANQGASIYLDQNKLKVNITKGEIDPSLLALVRSHKSELINYLSSNFAQEKEIIPIAELKNGYPLSSSQRRIWILSQMEVANAAFNIPAAYEFEGELDFEALEKSFLAMIKRHESLRTKFGLDSAGEPNQIIIPIEEIGFKINYLDFTEGGVKKSELHKIIEEEFSKPFDLINDQSIRTGIIKVSKNRWIYTCVMHHIITDGWSLEIFMKELLACYNAYSKGGDLVLPELRIQYKDFAVWQNKKLQGDNLNADKEYWLKQFSGNIPVIDFPTTKPRPKVKTYNGSIINTQIGETITKDLNKICQKYGCTLFMGLLASVKALVYKYSGQEDIIIGSPIAGRDNIDLEHQIGFYVNSLAFRTKFEGRNSFVELLKIVKKNTLDGYDHQFYPFDELVENLNLHRDISRSPIYDVEVLLQKEVQHHRKEDRKAEGLKVNFFDKVDQRVSRFDMVFQFSEFQNGLNLNITYNTDIYSESLVIQLSNHLEQLMKMVVEKPLDPLSSLSILTEIERKNQIYNFNNTKVKLPEKKTLVDLFEEQAEKRPNNIAVFYEGVSLTYQELSIKSSQLANHLVNEYNAGSNELVGIMLDRSEKLIISILGVLKAGCAYVPIDTSLPIERKEFLINESGIKLLITQTENIFDLDYYSGDVFAADVQLNSLEDSFANKKIDLSPKNLAYVIFTSGSTGKPKGVLVPHETIVNTINAVNTIISAKQGERALQFASPSFDAHIFELFVALAEGIGLYIIKEEDKKIPAKLEAYLNEHKIELATLPPAYLRNIDLNKLQSLTKLISAGEKVGPEIANSFSEIGTFFNAYGPTEISICASIFKLNKGEKVLNDNVSIGTPLPNVQIYIVNEMVQLVPLGVVGEICVGGKGVTSGYLNAPQLTSRKFIQSPFNPTEKIYKTGDLGRLNEDGNIEFVGRKDDQLKLNGYRIEPGEIETALKNHGKIDSAIVLSAINPSTGDNELIAYYNGAKEISTMDIRKFLGGKLPNYMVPSHFIQVDKFPITTNGKIDKKALLKIVRSNELIGKEYVEPRDKNEKEFSEIWKSVLGKEKVGITDSFFDLGGDSIKVLRMLSQFKKEFDIEIPVASVYENNTITDLLLFLKENQSALGKNRLDQNKKRNEVLSDLNSLKEKVLSSDLIADIDNVDDVYPMSDIEMGMVYETLLNDGFAVYHDQIVRQKSFIDFSLPRFKRAFELLVEKHPILRTGFNTKDFEVPVQIVRKRIEVQIDFKDISLVDTEMQHQIIQEYLSSQLLEPFNFPNAPLWRVSLFDIGGGEIVFVFQCHHSIIDGWSDSLLMTELNNIYIDLNTNPKLSLTPLKSNYKDFIIQHEIAKRQNLLGEYWKNELSEFTHLNLFESQPIESIENHIDFLSSESIKLLEKTASELNTTAKTISLTAYLYMLKVLSGENEVVTGLVTNLRPELEDSDKILGCFLNTIPLKIKFLGKITCKDLVHKVDKKLIELKGKEYLTIFEISRMHQTKSGDSNPFFDTFFNYVDFHAFDALKKGNDEKEEADLPQNLDLKLNNRTNFAMDFTINRTGGIYRTGISLTRKLKDGLSIQLMAEIYLKVLYQIIYNPNGVIDNIAIINEEDRHKLFKSFNATNVDYPNGESIVELLEKKAKEAPEKIALVFENKSISYKDLNKTSNRQARWLKDEIGAHKGECVAVMLDRSEWSVITMLSILKLGCIYVPIDKNLPESRIQFLLNDSRAKILITDSKKDYPKTPSVLIPNGFSSKIDSRKLNVEIEDNAPSYIIYTSGSTGNPKGVTQTYKMLHNLIMWDINGINLEVNGKHLQYSSFSFDSSLHDVLFTLATGGEIHVINEDLRKDFFGLKDYIIRHKINTISMPYAALTSFFNIVPKEFLIDNHIKEIISTGEQLIISGGLKEFLENYPNIKIHNFYGPSETHVVTGVTYSFSAGILPEKALIGKPVFNTQIYVLDKEMQIVPIGIEGEIYIGGSNLALGYHNREDLTKLKFVENPFVEGEVLYRSGDIGKWNEDGELEYLRRADNQIKIRGYRVEVGEIEQCLLANKLIKEVAVITKVLKKNEIQLIAYFVSEKSVGYVELKDYLRENLPEYMVPSFLYQLEAMPLTLNGKLDKRKLEDLSSNEVKLGNEFVQPSNQIEENIIEIWKNLLEQKKIGIKDNFFDLGGHSLKAMRLLSEYHSKFNVKLSLRELFAEPNVQAHGKLILKSSKSEFFGINELLGHYSYKLSDAQKRIWLLCQFEGGNTAHNQHLVLKINGLVNKKALETSLNILIDRHDVLRTIFKVNDEGEVIQFINPPEKEKHFLTVKDLSNKKFDKDCLGSTLIVNEEFQLSRGPLVRLNLCCFNEKEYVLECVMHNLIGDRKSLKLFTKELLYVYKKIVKNEALELKPISFQFKDYINYQQEQLEKEGFKQSKNYWLGKFVDELPILNLPTDKARPALKTYNGGVKGKIINKELTQKFKNVIDGANRNLKIGILSLVNALLYRYTNQKDIIVGTIDSGRNHLDWKHQIGLYEKVLPLRTIFNESDTFQQLYLIVKQCYESGLKNQYYSFERLVEDLDLGRDLSRAALFNVLVEFEDFEFLNNVFENFEELNLSYCSWLGRKTTKFDLTFKFVDHGENIHVSLEYNNNLYAGSTIDQILGHLENLMESISNCTNKSISKLPYLGEIERNKILIEFNNTSVQYPKTRSLIKMFEDQVEKTPNLVAIECEGRRLTFKELDEIGNQLGGYLRNNYKVKPDNLIGINLPRSEWMIISILGVLKSGGAYVPIDPEYPLKRKKYIEENSQFKICIDEEEIEKFKLTQDNYSKKRVDSHSGPNNLSYVIYTSGSTGKPKGVMVENRNVCSFINWCIDEFSVDDFDVAYCVTSISFDISILEIFYPLVSGKRLKILKKPTSIPKLLETDSKVFLNTVPSLVKVLISENVDLSPVSTLIIGGEYLSDDLIKKLPNIDATIRNLYGPTEDTIYSACYRIDTTKSTTIGKPISNKEIIILDDHLELTPIGVPGEIYLSGEGVSRGYLNQPKLTSNRFIPNPFKNGTLMYKTGDVGKWNQNGNIDFIGRKDDQVKIRGFRIELGEIEKAILEVKEIKEAVVVSWSNELGESSLVAYISSDIEQDMMSLKEILKDKVPNYMIPSYIIQLDRLPLTLNGKINKKALPDPISTSNSAEHNYVPPKGEVQQEMVEIWKHVLGKKVIGVMDDFFVLGGQSLKAAKLVIEYHRRLQVKVDLKDVFLYTTIEAQSLFLKNLKRDSFVEIEQVEETGIYPISDAQRRLWVLSQFEEGSLAYNMPSHMSLNRNFDIEILKKAIKSTIGRHEILRTVFYVDESGEVLQKIMTTEALGFSIDFKDFRKERDKQKLVKEYMFKDAGKKFDLEKGPLLRGAFLQLEDNQYDFYFNMHHIISDGWSMKVLAKDVLAFYDAYENNKTPDLSPLRIQYKDYAAWQHSQLKRDEFSNHKKYWLNRLSGDIPTLDLPSKKLRPKVKTYNGAGLRTYISSRTTRLLKDYCRKNGGSVFMGLLSTWNILFNKYTGLEDITIGTYIAGRDHADLQNQIGFYINILALRNKINPNEDYHSVFKRFKESTLEAFSHQMYPFDRLVEELDLKRDTSRGVVVDVLLTLQNFDEESSEVLIDEREVDKIVDSGFGLSKFDIEITFKEVGDNLFFNITYNSDVYEYEMIKNLMVHFKNLLFLIIENPEKEVGSLNFLEKSECQNILLGFNNDGIDFSVNKSVVELFEEQVIKTPYSVALIYDNKEITYNELNELTNMLTHFVSKNKDESSSPNIGVMLKRSFYSVAAMLAILKSGNCYVPIDYNYPINRVNYILDDSCIEIVITQRDLLAHQALENKFLIDVNEINLSQEPKENNGNRINLDDPSYVIYTSGSTGKPKGVVQTHRTLSNLIGWDNQYSGIDIGLRHLQYASFSFDASLHDVLFVLSSGGSLYIAKENIRVDFELLKHVIIDHKIEVLSFPFSALSNFYNQNELETFKGHSIKHIVSTAEQLYIGGNLKGFLNENPEVVLHNHYGPSETHVVTSCSMSAREKNIIDRPSIGKPISNTDVYVLDTHLNPVPIGVKGEIYVGGSNLAKGYLNSIMGTANKFIDHPFKKGEKLYKTGDIGFWNEDGTAEFIGRNDDQIKVRGYRIELKEIERTLLNIPEIDDAIVNTYPIDNDYRIAAYFISSKSPSLQDLRVYLKKYLPDYMVPSSFIQIEKIPLTLNGKVNKQKLPSPAGSSLATSAEYVAPRDSIEEEMVEIWQKLLNKENIGVKDDFFELGGHSINATKLISKYEKAFKIKLKLKDIFANTTIADHKELIDLNSWFDNANNSLEAEVETVSF